MKVSKLIVFATLLLAASAPLHAQSGCINSPENPTAILACVGTVAATMTHLRAKIRARKNSSQK